MTPIFNRNFLTSMVSAAAFIFIYFVNRDKRYNSSVKDVDYFLKFVAPAIFLFVLYNAFRVEIGNHFHSLIVSSADETNADSYLKTDDLYSFDIIWQINYSMFFLTLLSIVNIRKIKSEVLGLVNLGLNALILFVFLLVGLYLLGALRTNYLSQMEDAVFNRGISYIIIRYVSLAFAAALIIVSYKYIKQEFSQKTVSPNTLLLAFDFVFYVALLWFASSELINLTDLFKFSDSYKLGLSILWGIYSLLLIILGIVKQKKYLRLGAIVLFALTLVKLFFYDIAELGTISKTVVFVSLGILLLITSFLYNKYKDLIFEKSET